MKITKRQLRRIIKEEKRKLIKEQSPPSQDVDSNPGRDDMFTMDDELKELHTYISHMNHYALVAADLMGEMSMRYGELAALATYANNAANAAVEVGERFDIALEEMAKEY